MPPALPAADVQRPAPDAGGPSPVPPPAKLAGESARTLVGVRRKLMWAHVGTAVVGAVGGWIAVPYLFQLHAAVVVELQRAFVILVGSAILFGGVVSWIVSRRIGALAARLQDGGVPDPELIGGAAWEAVWHPRILAAWAAGSGTIAVIGTAGYGYVRLQMPIHTAVNAAVFGVCISAWLALMASGSERLMILPVTRVLSTLGVTDWPGPRTALTSKVAFLMVVAALLPSVFIGAVAYHFSDEALSSQVGHTTMQEVPVVLAGVAALDQNGAAPKLVQARLVKASKALGPQVRLGLLRDGRVVSEETNEVGRLVGLRDFESAPTRAGSTLIPDTLDVATWAPLPEKGYVGVALVDRRVVRDLLGPYRTTVMGLVFAAMVLLGAAGFVTARGVQAPLSDVVSATSRVAQGNLVPPRDRALTDDEIGELGGHVDRMRQRLADTVSRVLDLTGRVRDSSGATLEQSHEIGGGAESQARAVSAAVAAIEEMDRSLRSVAEGVRQLATAFREGTEAASRIGGDFDEFASDVEAVARGAAEAAQAVAGFSRDAGQVAEEVGGLSAAAGRATHAVNDVDAALKRMREHARGAARAAQDTIQVAHEGAVNVRRTVEGIERIREGADAAATRVEALSQRISEVDRVLAVIDDIAEKTNLLALNASIIAAQAGEHGKSFAVVAGEIRDLATRTASSTREIASTVHDVQDASSEAVKVIRESSDRVAEGVSLAGAAEESLNQILITAASSSQAAEEIAGATDRQVSTVGHVSREIDQVAAMAERIAGLAGDQAGAGRGAKGAVERIAELNLQMNESVASLADRNRHLLSSFTAMADHITQVERAVRELTQGSNAILQETEHIHAVADTSAERASRLESAARELDAAADALLAEVGFFKVE